MQMPCLLSQVSTERILTFSTPELSISLALIFVDLLVGLDEHAPSDSCGFVDVVAAKAADEAFAQLDDFVFAFVDGLDPDAVGGAAILLRG